MWLGSGQKHLNNCAGFLRIRESTHPLDASAVHPERYAVVEQMAQDLGVELKTLIGNEALVQKIAWTHYVTAELGQPTIRDILSRKNLVAIRGGVLQATEFRDVHRIEDVQVGMVLDGVITGSTAFGAFVILVCIKIRGSCMYLNCLIDLLKIR